MTTLKIVHVGNVILGRETVFTLCRPSLHKTIAELNDWLFDYLYVNQLPVRQLPPLDDWEHAMEDNRLWFIHFPNDEWLITIKSELLEF
jgi:hypothetical protein